MGSDQLFRTTGLLMSVLVAGSAAAAYDLNDVPLGASESEIKQHFPNANCRALEWSSRAADRRCDDSRNHLGGVDASVTFYLKRDALEGFDVRFDRRARATRRRRSSGSRTASAPASRARRAGAAPHCSCGAAPSRKSSTGFVRACAAP